MADKSVTVFLSNPSFARVPIDYNKGAESIFESTLRLLQSEVSPARIYTTISVSSSFRTRSTVCHLNAANERNVRDVTFWGLLVYMNRLWWALVWRFMHRRLRIDLSYVLRGKTLNAIMNSDIFIHLGMDQFKDSDGTVRFFEHAFEILTALALDKPVVMLAESIGPVRGRVSRWLARNVLERVTLLTLREHESFTQLADLHVRKSALQTACPAFLFVHDSVVGLNLPLREKSSNTPNLIIGFTPSVTTARMIAGGAFGVSYKSILNALVLLLPSDRILSFKPIYRYAHRLLESATNAYASMVANVIDTILSERPDCRVLLIPFIYEKSAVGNDVALSKTIYARLRHKSQTSLLIGPYSASEAKAIIGTCDLFIGDKLHACIAALSQGIPAIGIGYQFKVRAIFDTLNLGDCVIDNYEVSDIIVRIRKALSENGTIRGTLAQKLPGVYDLARLNFTLIARLLSSTHDSPT